MNAPAGSFDHSRRAGPPSRRLTIKAPFLHSMELRRLQSSAALLVFDGAAVCGAFFLMQALFGAWARALDACLIILPVFSLCAVYNGTYKFRSIVNYRSGYLRAIGALLLTECLCIILEFQVQKYHALYLEDEFIFLFFSSVALAVTRFFFGYFVRWRCGIWACNQLVIWDGGPEVRLPGAVCISAEVFRLLPTLNDPVALNRIGMIMRNADRVIVSSPPKRAEVWAHVLKGAGVEGEVVNDAAAQMGALGMRSVDGHSLLKVSSRVLCLSDRIKKRILDLFISFSAIIFFAPLMFIVAAAIKFEDGGPVFFVQKRIGRGNLFFAMIKFRSMSVNSEGVDGGVSASPTDRRITRVGKFIRSTSIDELPQLFNVLLGQMSLVGPRPHALGSLAGDKLFWEVDPRYWQRHALKPGLTGLAQVRGYRGATDTENDLSQRLNADLEYSRGWTLGRDLWIMPSTLRVLLHDRAF